MTSGCGKSMARHAEEGYEDRPGKVSACQCARAAHSELDNYYQAFMDPLLAQAQCVHGPPRYTGPGDPPGHRPAAYLPQTARSRSAAAGRLARVHRAACLVAHAGCSRCCSASLARLCCAQPFPKDAQDMYHHPGSLAMPLPAQQVPLVKYLLIQ